MMSEQLVDPNSNIYNLHKHFLTSVWSQSLVSSLLHHSTRLIYSFQSVFTSF